MGDHQFMGDHSQRMRFSCSGWFSGFVKLRCSERVAGVCLCVRVSNNAVFPLFMNLIVDSADLIRKLMVLPKISQCQSVFFPVPGAETLPWNTLSQNMMHVSLRLLWWGMETYGGPNVSKCLSNINTPIGSVELVLYIYLHLLTTKMNNFHH